MALRDILAVIAADAEREAAAVLQAAEDAYESRMRAAEAEAAEVRAGLLAQAGRAAHQDKARRLHRARLEVLRGRVVVQEDAFLAAVDRARAILATVRERPDYPDIMARLLLEALTHYQEPAVAIVDPADADLMRSLADGREGRIREVAVSEDIGAGVVLHSADGRVVTENTLESRLQRSLADLRSVLADLLSSDPASGGATDDVGS